MPNHQEQDGGGFGDGLKEDNMDHSDYSGHGNVSLAVSFIAGIFAWVGSYSLPEIVKSLSMLVSIIAGIMAIRYYYYATKKQR